MQGHLIKAHLFQLSLGITQSVTHPRKEGAGRRERHAELVEDVSHHISAKAHTPKRITVSLLYDLVSHNTHSLSPRFLLALALSSLPLPPLLSLFLPHPLPPVHSSLFNKHRESLIRRYLGGHRDKRRLWMANH